MNTVTVTHHKNDDYKVTIQQVTTTHHVVTLSDDYYQKLTHGSISKEDLLQRSFAFLLERESNSMILSHFALSVIQQYFSDYEKTVRC